MSKRWVWCGVCGSLTRRDVSAKKRRRCAECGIKAGIRANLAQHYGYGQGPGDNAAKRPPKPGRQASGPAPVRQQPGRAA